MKTAISLPNPIFNEAERYAKRARMNRSQLYGAALEEYLARHSPDEVTEAMNFVVNQISGVSDLFCDMAARHVLERVEW